MFLSSISDERNSKVTVIGCGEVGKSSIHKSIQIGAFVTAIDVNENILKELKNKYGENISTHISGSDEASEAIRTADLVVGAVLLPGRKPPVGACWADWYLRVSLGCTFIATNNACLPTSARTPAYPSRVWSCQAAAGRAVWSATARLSSSACAWVLHRPCTRSRRLRP